MLLNVVWNLEVAYNVQTTVDAKNNIPIDYKVTNENDSKAMGNMVQKHMSPGTNTHNKRFLVQGTNKQW